MIRSLLFLLLFTFTLPSLAEDKGWTSWVNLGGTITSDPSACTAGNWTVVVARNTNLQLSYRKRYLPTGVWSPWKFLPNISSQGVTTTAAGSPSVTCTHSIRDSVEVSVVGTNQRLWGMTFYIGNSSDSYFSWFPYRGFNAANFSGPATTKWEGLNSSLFVRGGDNRIYYQNPPNPNLGFTLLVSEQSYSDPTAVWGTKDRLDFFYRDSSSFIWQQYLIGNVWSSRVLLPGAVYSAPEVISRNIHSLDLFVLGRSNHIWHKTSVNNVWGPWYDLGGSVTSGPGAAVYANSTRMMLFGRWTDGTLRYKAWAP